MNVKAIPPRLIAVAFCVLLCRAAPCAAALHRHGSRRRMLRAAAARAEI
jgi:hypothetical protein